MKREVKSIILSILIGMMIIILGNGNINVQAQEAGKKADEKKATDEGKTSETEAKTGLYWDWLNDFENCEDWRANSSSPLGETKIRKIEGRPTIVKEDGSTETVQPDQFGLKGGKDENGLEHQFKYVLGVKTYFLERGYDRVEVFPPNEYIIRGKAKEIKIWALGRKFRHTLYVKLRDYRGNTHKIKVGRLDFWGWKELSVIVPGWLPQSTRYALLDKNLHFVSFVVDSDNFEVPGTFYFYVDNFRVRTDLTEFTGDKSIKDNW
jgi:hypothetical protein